MMGWNGFVWLRIGSSGRVLPAQYRNFGFHKGRKVLDQLSDY
jgi:hypothetical protein